MVNGKVLYLLRKIKGFTQAEVARRLKISQQTYSKIERSEIVEHKQLLKIIKAMESSEEEVGELVKMMEKGGSFLR